MAGRSLYGYDDWRTDLPDWRVSPPSGSCEPSNRLRPRSFRSFLLFPSAGWSIEISQGGAHSPVQGEKLTWHFRTRKTRSDYEFIDEGDRQSRVRQQSFGEAIALSLARQPRLHWKLKA
jgi:hypothetical protein